MFLFSIHKSTILVPCSEIFSFFLGGRGPTRSGVCPGSNAPGRTRRTGTLPAQKLTSFPYDGGAYLAAGFFDNRKTGRNESGRRSVPCGIFDTMPQAVSKMSKMKAGLYFTHYVQTVSKMSKMRRGRFSTPCLKHCLKWLKTCSPVLMFPCSNVPLFYCSIVLMFPCSNVPLF